MNHDASNPEPSTGDPEPGLSLHEAVVHIAKAMGAARSPIVIGLENLSTQAQRSAIRLARSTHATIDSSSDNLGRGNLFALQKRGRVSATLGEIKMRSDLVIFWCCDPFADDTSFGQQFIGSQCQTFAVGPEPNSTTEFCDHFLQIEFEQSIEAIWSLRAQLQGLPMHLGTDSLQAKLVPLAEQMKSCRYGAMFWGSQHCDPEFDLQADGIHALLRERNQHTRFVGLPYRNDANGLSAENVSTWSTGFPFAVNWNREAPRQYWLEYSDERVSERDEWDFLLLFDADELVAVSQPTVDCPAMEIRLRLAEFGNSEGGDYCRFDDINLTHQPKVASEAPSALKIIESISSEIENRV